MCLILIIIISHEIEYLNNIFYNINVGKMSKNVGIGILFPFKLILLCEYIK